MTFVDVFHDKLKALCSCLARGVGAPNGNRNWLRFWEVAYENSGNGVRVKRGTAQSLLFETWTVTHVGERISTKADSARLLLKSFIYLFRTIYMCFFHTEIHVSVTHPKQSMLHL